MINTKLQNIIDTKSAIGNAIVNKGGTINSATPFYEYAPAIENLSSGGVGNYSTFVAQAQDTSKYTVYNGYNAISNPTPNLSNNFAFNQWLLNNSATGNVILSNVILTVTNNSIFVDNTAGINEVFMPFVNNTNSYGGDITAITINDGFIYAGGGTNERIQKFHEGNLVFNNSSNSYGGSIRALAINNGFIYAVGGTNQTLQKFHESNLVFVNNSTSYLATVETIAINNGFIYIGGSTASGINRGVTKIRESNLALNGANLVASSTVNYGGTINAITINNGFIYVGGRTNQTVQKFHEGNLAFVGATASYGGNIFSLAINNGFIYAGGSTNQTVQQFYEGNLVFVNSTNSYGGIIYSVTTNNGFIYVGGATNQRVQKFHEDNLAFVGNTASYGGTINSIAINNGFIYAGGSFNQTVQKFYEQTDNLVVTNIFSITTIKE
jgi:hypothetical protein